MRHVKKVAYMLIAVMAIFVCQGTIFPPAAALATGGATYTTSENNAFVTSVMSDINSLPTLPPTAVNPATSASYTAAEEFSGMTTARMAGGFGIPALNALGTITMGGAAIYTAYEVGNYFRAKIAGDTAATVTFTPTWTSYCSASTPGDNGSTTCGTANSSWSPVNFGGWGVQQKGGIGPTTPGLCAQGCWVLGGSNGAVCANGTVTANCTGAGFTGDNNANNTASSYSIYTNNPTLTNVALNTSAGSTDCKAVGACAFYWRTFAQMRQVIQQSTCNDACYNAANQKIPAVLPSAANGAQANNLVNAETQCGGFLGASVGTAAQEACSAVLNYAVNPACDTDGSNCQGAATAGATVTIPGGGTGGTSFQPFVLPKPQLDESYQDYLQSLRDKGYVGTVTVNEVDPSGWLSTAAARGVPDGTIVGAKVGSGTEIYQYEPLTGDVSSPQWADNPDQIPTATTAITLTKTPTGTYTPSTASPPGGGLDLSPLTDISFGCKFPFGLFCYASDVTAWFNVTPVTPEFTFSIPGFTVGGTALTGANTYDVSLSAMDTYMSTIRSILSVALWVGAGWIVASRVLGLQLGDPGAAIDDGMPL